MHGLAVGVATTALLVTSAGAATARAVSLPYLAGSGLDSSVSAYGAVVAPGVGGVMSATQVAERTVTVSVHDRTGQPIAGVVYQPVNSYYKQEIGTFCGTSVPMRLARPGQLVEVVLEASTVCSALSAPTTGTVTLTFGH